MTLGFIGYQSPLPGCAISAFDIHCGSNKNCRACIQMRRRVLVRADGAGGAAADRNLLHDARACRVLAAAPCSPQSGDVYGQQRMIKLRQLQGGK